MDRSTTARAAADALAALPHDSLRPALVGFDGFIDAIIDVVDRRSDMRPDAYSRIETIEHFALRVGSAAGKSTNIELVVKEERFGGNGPLMAGALGRLGTPVDYVGAVGKDNDPRSLHPLYEELARRSRSVTPVAPPARTDALEFGDGKVMLGKPANVQTVTWELLKQTLGLPWIQERVAGAGMVAVVNWVMMGGVEGIWQGLADEVLAKLPADQRPRLFIDLCDPAKRTDEDLRRALSMLTRMSELAPVTLGLNLAESERIAQVLSLNAYQSQGMSTMGDAIVHASDLIRAALRLDTVVVHPREGAGGSDARGNTAWIEGPFTRSPKLSTGAGDHFNAGFAFAQVAGLPLDQALAVGVGVSGAYVRDALSPDRERLVSFLRDLPAPER